VVVAVMVMVGISILAFLTYNDDYYYYYYYYYLLLLSALTESKVEIKYCHY